MTPAVHEAETRYAIHFAACRARKAGLSCLACLQWDADVDAALQAAFNAACAATMARMAAVGVTG